MIKILLKSIKLSWIDLINNWRVIPAIPVFGVIWTITSMIAAPLGIIGDILIFLIFMALLSIYYNWLRNSKFKKGLQWKELIIFNQEMFHRTLTISIILWFATMIIHLVAGHSTELAMGLGLLIAVLFNPLPEIIYNYRADGPDAFSYALNFVKQHWPIWFLPFLIINLPALLINPKQILIILAGTNPLLPINGIETIQLTAYPIANLIISLVVIHWFFLLRGRIYEQLD